MIIDTGEQQDGRNVYRCDQCGVRIATHYPIEKCRCYCAVGVAELWRRFREARKRYKAAGSPNVSDDERQSRLAVCHNCPSKLLTVHFGRKELGQCKGCGCFVALKSKWATEHCPRGHWPGDPPYVEPKCGGCPQKDAEKP